MNHKWRINSFLLVHLNLNYVRIHKHVGWLEYTVYVCVCACVCVHALLSQIPRLTFLTDLVSWLFISLVWILTFVDLHMNQNLPVSHALSWVRLMFRARQCWMFNEKTWFWELSRHSGLSESFCFLCALHVHLSSEWHFKRCQKVNRIMGCHESREQLTVTWDCHQFSKLLMLISLLLLPLAVFFFLPSLLCRAAERCAVRIRVVLGYSVLMPARHMGFCVNTAEIS